MKTMDVKPGISASGEPLLVKHPITKRALPHDEPTTVPLDSFWARRLACQDVIPWDAKKHAKKTPKKGKK